MSGRTPRDQSGIGMVMIMGVGALVMMMAFVAHRIFDGAITSSSGHVTYEQAIHAAEHGVDRTLARISSNPDYSNVTSGWSGSAGSERDWVLAQAGAMTAEKAPNGEFVALKPADRNIIYGVSYLPSKAAPRQTRVVKAEYLLSSFSPDHAILVGGDLRLNGNPAVGGIAGNVHANGNVELVGSPSVSGQLTTSGGFSGKDPASVAASYEAGVPTVTIPEIDPLAEWYRHKSAGDFASGAPLSMTWYDLCPDGTVRRPDGSAPCAGSLAPGFVSGSEYRGFRLSGDNWDYGGNSTYDGAYFAYRKSIKIAGNPGEAGVPWRATLLAEPGPDDNSTCPNLTLGDIEVAGNPSIVPFLQGLTFMAGRDLRLTGNPTASYSGLMLSKEQLSVSGNPRLTGSIIAESTCNTPGSRVDQLFSDVPGNPTIAYDGGLEALIGAIPRTTLWLEL